jgi:hypothetical protein
VVLFAAEGQDDVIPRWDVIEVSKITPYRQMYGLPPDSYYPATCVDQVPRLTLADAYEQYRTRLVTVAMRQRSHVGADYSGLGLAIIDTYTAATDLSDDQTNAAGTNQQIFTRLHRLSRELDCFVLVVDHMGKDTARGTRGSTAKEASADVVLTVTGTVSDEGIVSNTAMVVRKLRGGAINKRVMFSLQPVVMPRDEEGHRRDGVVVKWDVASAKLRQGRGPAAQNRRHPLLMMAIDNALLDALPAQWEMVKNGAHAFRAVDEGLIREKFRVCHPATDEDGPQRLDTIRKAYARAMKACLVSRAIGQITLADGKLRIWRTDYSHQDTSNVSRD